jgi:hypothetical protein
MQIDSLAESDAIPKGTHAMIEEDSFESFERVWTAVTGKHANFTRPFGSSLESPVGFVLSYGEALSGSVEPMAENPVRLPWGFVG